ncbi:hypothetical protein LguiB_016938 [Lonicera macranthoides]
MGDGNNNSRGNNHGHHNNSNSSNRPEWLKKYDLIGKIGEGTYGLVFLAKIKDNRSKSIAIKKFKQSKDGDGVSPTAIREIMLLREITHENVVKLEDVHINHMDMSLYLAFDYAEHDLYEIIRHHRDKANHAINQYSVKSMLWQLLNGLNYLHSNWIMHRDLKPSNILVMGEGEEQGVVKIADFGLARIYQAPLKPLSENGVVVTIWYRAPELLLGAKHYTSAVDMWAVGCIFAELLTLKPLFQGQEVKATQHPFQLDQLDKIFKVLGHPTQEKWPSLVNLPHWQSDLQHIQSHKYDNPGLHSVVHLSPKNPAYDLLSKMLEYKSHTWSCRFHQQTRHMPLSGIDHSEINRDNFELMKVYLCLGMEVVRRCFYDKTYESERMEDREYLESSMCLKEGEVGRKRGREKFLPRYDPRKRISAAQALEHEYFRMEPLPGRNSLVPPQPGDKVVNYPIRPVDTTTDFEGTTSLQSNQPASSGNQLSGGMVGPHVMPNRSMPRPMQMVGMQRMQPQGMAAYNLAPSQAAAAAAAAAAGMGGGMNPMQQRGVTQAQAQAQAHQQQLRRKDPGMGMSGYPPQQKSRRF